MEFSLLMEYGWVLLVLIVLEGLLATDNALVLAIMVKHLPEEKRKKALFYGLLGAFVFRFVHCICSLCVLITCLNGSLNPKMVKTNM